MHKCAAAFANTWKNSVELRVAVFVIVLQFAFLLWATVLAREVSVAAATVLCKLLVYDREVSCVALRHNDRTSLKASAGGKRHKTGGGPPPGSPPAYNG